MKEKKSNINVCLIQLAVEPYNFEKNKNKIEKYVGKVMKLPKSQLPDIIVLPETWNIGFTINKVKEFADKNGEKTQQFLSELAKKYHVMIVGGSIVSHDTQKDIYQNLNINMDSEGKLLSKYAKVHLFSPSKENTVFTRGSHYTVISTNIMKNSQQYQSLEENKNNGTTVTTTKTTNNTSNYANIENSYYEQECIFSTAICYDIRFPEFIRSIALEAINLKKRNKIQLNSKQKQEQQKPYQKQQKHENSYSSTTSTFSTVTTTTTINNSTKITTTNTNTETTTTNTNTNTTTNLSDNNSSSQSDNIEGGLDILFVSAAWPYPRLQHWRNLLIARAIENQCFVVAVNNCGEMDGLIFCGHSLVIDPWGEILIEGKGPKDTSLLENSNNNNKTENNNNTIIYYDEKIELTEQVNGQNAFDEILITSLSFDILKDIRQRICVFNDRLPSVYNCN